MAVRGIRGATSVQADVPGQILEATGELLREILRTNAISEFDEIVSAIFTTTSDLTTTFPAEAARALGMSQVPLLCACEIPVVGSLPRCIRVLLHINTDKKQSEIVHVYLNEAKKLRPDVSSAQEAEKRPQISQIFLRRPGSQEKAIPAFLSAILILHQLWKVRNRR